MSDSDARMALEAADSMRFKDATSDARSNVTLSGNVRVMPAPPLRSIRIGATESSATAIPLQYPSSLLASNLGSEANYAMGAGSGNRPARRLMPLVKPVPVESVSSLPAPPMLRAPSEL